MPWEIGLAEAHQTLLASRLRDRVILRADGGMRTGHDVIVAALLGAEEYGFGTIALVAAGCIMARVCHTNNCPVGITSQKEQLRAKFTATPDQIVEFFLFIAEEIRHELASLGYRYLSEIVGRTDLLRPRTELELTKAKDIDLTPLLHPFVTGIALRERDPEPHSNGAVLDNRILADEEVAQAIENQLRVSKSYPIKNTDRSVAARIAGRIAESYGDDHFGGSIDLSFHGSAGQSFGAFLVKGITLRLDGESNDYVGKGMSGGEIIIRADSEARSYISYASEVIIGNACLYGATGGALFAAGSAGERFAVRNSGATAVIEGAGAHCCEYMTGGTVVVLGHIGANFGAGMSGGRAFVLDVDGTFPAHINPDNDKLLGRISPEDEKELLELVRRHHAETGSPVAEHLLADWTAAATKFLKVSFEGHSVSTSNPNSALAST
jgi:glutamate synthase (ferredoxin)